MTKPSGVPFQIVDPTDRIDWDRKLIASYPDATPFHGAAWARVLRATYGYEPRYIIEDGGDERRLVLPMMEVRSWLTGRRGVSLPFTDECHTLGADQPISHRAFRHLLSVADERKWGYFELRSSSLVDEAVPPSLSFFGHKLQLHPDLPKLFASFYGTVRTSIRKAEQAGVKVEFSTSPESTREFYALLCQTRGRHGLPPQPPQFFDAIQRLMLQHDQGTVVLAKVGSKTIAGAVFLHLGRTVIYKYAASDDRYRNFQGNNWVLWKAIEHYAQKRYTTLDFGRTSASNQGLRRFKLGWNTSEASTRYYRYQRSARAFTKASDHASGGTHTGIFRAMPLGLSRLIGTALYKHLA